MSQPHNPSVLISEVGPRDGLQSVKATMPTADKLRWIDALAAAGLREIEVASFVPAHLLPQMADAAQVVQHALRHSGVRVMALVPNLRGAQAALAAGAQKLTLPVSAKVVPGGSSTETVMRLASSGGMNEPGTCMSNPTDTITATMAATKVM